MDELLNELSVWVLPLIFISVAAGVLCGAFAIYGIWRENNLLMKCRDKNIFNNSGKSASARTETLRSYLDELRSDKKEHARIGQGKLLQLRLETISDAISSEGVKVMPSLHDLHSLSMQDEMSRFSSVWLRTITSFLLIMGIFGTLAGVHKVMSSGADTQITFLRAALEPSMYAVFFTVLLMWVRGGYIAKLDSYLERLDLFTVTEIIPTMQPVTKVQNTAHDLSQHFEQLQKKVAELETLNTKMQTLQTNLNKFLENMSKNTADVSALRVQIEGVRKSLSEAQTTAAERRDALSKLVQNGQSQNEKINMGVTEMSQYVKSVKQRCKEVESQYNNLVTNLVTISGEVQQSREVVTDLSFKSEKLEAMGKCAASYEGDLSSVSGQLDQVLQTADRMRGLSDEIKASQNLVVDSSDTAQQILQETQNLVNQIKSINAPFSDSVESGRSSLHAVRVELDNKIEKIKEISADIRKAGEKLAKKLGV